MNGWPSLIGCVGFRGKSQHLYSSNILLAVFYHITVPRYNDQMWSNQSVREEMEKSVKHPHSKCIQDYKSARPNIDCKYCGTKDKIGLTIFS